MILFELRCRLGHGFEAWFRDGDTFDAQAAAGEIACPLCGDTGVAKAPMAPRIARRRAGPGDQREEPPAGRLGRALAELRRHIEENFEDVGARFAEEARKIHYGESDPRNIRGEANAEDARALIEEGIEVLPVPWLRRRHS